MTNLEPYSLVSNQPSINREMSIVTRRDTELENIWEKIVEVLGNDTEVLESAEILSETHYHQIAEKAILRLGIRLHQKNVLVRMTLRSLHASITNQKANILRDSVYQRIYQSETS
jgi:phenylalanyl-tRNA synthetase alpha chain